MGILNYTTSIAAEKRSVSFETRQKISIALSGDRNPMWGRIPWNKGKPVSLEIRKKFRESHLGHRHLDETKRKISIANKGQIPWMKGKHHTPEVRDRIRISMSGSKTHLWRGGKSLEPYGRLFNKKLKEEIRKRDGYFCRNCLIEQNKLYKNTKRGIRNYKLYIHHINYNKKDNQPSNLISLCLPCHGETNHNRDFWEKKFAGMLMESKGG